MKKYNKTELWRIISVCQRGEEGKREGEMSEVDWEIQTSSCNVNESWIWSIQCGEYSQWLCNVLDDKL